VVGPLDHCVANLLLTAERASEKVSEISHYLFTAQVMAHNGQRKIDTKAH